MSTPPTKSTVEAPESEQGPAPRGVKRGVPPPVGGIPGPHAAEAERDRTIDELRQAQERIRADLEATARLHQLGSLFVREGNLEPILAEIVDAAIAISGADFGNIQLLDAQSSDLKIVAQRGFADWWLEFWNSVSKGHGVCGTALAHGERVVVDDVERSPIFTGTPALEIQRRAGVRAVQSTPLVSRPGKPLGMFSTHWRKPGRPDARSLRWLDLLARHAADIIERAQNEAALRESEARYRSLFDHMSEGLAHCRMLYDGDRPVDFVYLDVNPAFEALTGQRGVVGKKVSEVFPGILESEPGLIERYARVARGFPERFEAYAESSRNWFDISAYSPAKGDFVAAFHIITERKRAEEELRASEERLRLAQQAARVGAFEWDIQSGVNTWTPELEALYGLPPGGFAKTEAAWESLVHPDDRADAVRRVEQAFETGETTEWEWRVVWPDASVHWLAGRWRVFKDRSGKPLRMTGINIDITERKRAEELRASEAALREADRQKNQFLATLSHELRNPLAPIRNSLYILERAATGGEQARRAQAILHRQIGQLTWLIDDLLDVTRITHGKVQLQRERLDLNELAHRAVEDHRTVFAKSAVRLEVLPAPAEVWIDGDRVRLAQIIGNLLQNAAKFTPRGGKATVSIQTDAARGLAFLTVRDTGSGIEPEMLPRLFQAFTQADATLDRSKGGLGLGLALVKGLVELHGGSVRVASDGLDKGAAFTISLPLDVTVARAMSAQRGLAGTAAPRRVLVIEDNEDAADTLREVLELDEHVVEVAYSGRDGIEKARAFHPDVVLCDIGLPEMDGYQVARTMRADPELGHVGLVAVSGYAQREDVATAKEAGFEVHLAKPPSIEALERAIAAVGRSRSR